MSTETIEKKVYPSQLNSKTISARIPVTDYVNFLQESITKGISLNDWLLLKIYNSESKMGGVVSTENEIIRINSSELNSYQFEFWKENFDTNNYLELDKEDVIDLMEMVRIKQLLIDSKFNNKQASLHDVKLQLSILINNKFKDNKDKKDFKNELFELLNELQ